MTGISYAKSGKLAAACFALMIAILCMSGAFLRASAADGETSGTLTLWCVKDDDIVSGMEWHLYRVGHREKDDYIFEGDFADCRPTLGDRTQPMLKWDAETVADAGNTLKIMSIAEEIPERANGETDARGALTFPALENGLYLVWGETLQRGDTTYIPGALFFEMNGADTALLNAYPKIIIRTRDDHDVRYSVRKVWQNDENQEWNRAVSIVAERYRNNQLYDEVTLSEANNWTFSWSDSDANEWFVREKIIPENYSVTYKNNQTQYLIVNTYEGETSVTTTAVSAVTTESVTTAAVTNAGSTTASGSRTTSETLAVRPSTQTQTVTTTVRTAENKVPQTGQLWWPVPALAGGGLLLTGIGIALRKKEDDE